MSVQPVSTGQSAPGLALVGSDGRAYSLAMGQTTIGRSPENTIVVAATAVSRLHAQVHWNGQQCFVMDLGSSNGTAVNGQRLTPQQWVPIQTGAVLTLAGQASLVLTAQVPAEAEQGPATVPEQPAVQGAVHPPTKERAAAPPWLWIGLAAGGLLLVLLIALALRGGSAPTATPTESAAPSGVAPTLAVTVTVPITSTLVLTPTLAPTPSPDAVVIYPSVNLRAGPGTTYDIIGSVEQGDALDVIGKATGCRWLLVVTPKSVEGWVTGDSQYVTLNLACDSIPAAPAPAGPGPTPSAQPTQAGTVAVPIQNDTGGTMTLTLDGPFHYEFTLPEGATSLQVLPGVYRYTAVGCGGETKTGEEDLSAMASEWRWWCGAF